MKMKINFDLVINEELETANGNHMQAFLNMCDARGTDKRTKQFKYWDSVVNYIIKNEIWFEHINSYFNN